MHQKAMKFSPRKNPKKSPKRSPGPKAICTPDPNQSKSSYLFTDTADRKEQYQFLTAMREAMTVSDFDIKTFTKSYCQERREAKKTE